MDTIYITIHNKETKGIKEYSKVLMF